MELFQMPDYTEKKVINFALWAVHVCFPENPLLGKSCSLKICKDYKGNFKTVLYRELSPFRSVRKTEVLL